MRNWRYGNLAKIKGAVGQSKVANVPLLVTCLDVYQDATTGFYRVNCIDTKLGTPYFNVPVISAMTPYAKSMGLLIFANGDPTLPQFLALGR